MTSRYQISLSLPVMVKPPEPTWSALTSASGPLVKERVEVPAGVVVVQVTSCQMLTAELPGIGVE